MKRIDITGRRFGRLIVIRPVKRKNKLSWECKCDCGNVTYQQSHDLIVGKVVSCGCYHNEIRSQLAQNCHKTHGGSKTRLFKIWSGMLYRCKDNSAKVRKHYKDKGITVCNEWKKFVPFRDWALSHGYRNDLTIDRIDNDKGYYPENCRWATYRQQENNKSDNHRVVIGGKEKTISEWSQVSGIREDTILYRVNAGWAENRLLTKGQTHERIAS